MIQDLVEKFRQDAADQERKEMEIQHCFGQVELALSRVKAEANLKNSELQNELRGKEDALALKIQGIKNQTNLSEQDFRQLIDLQQKKITNLTDTILAVKSKITEFEFKLENFLGEKIFTSEFIGDYILKMTSRTNSNNRWTWCQQQRPTSSKQPEQPSQKKSN